MRVRFGLAPVRLDYRLCLFSSRASTGICGDRIKVRHISPSSHSNY
jgi:hypothetical protein